MRSEAEMIQAIADGEEQALARLYHLFSERVYNTALSYAQVVEDAEEITQDVFVKIFQGASNFQGNSSLNTWVYRITVNTSLNHLKKRNRFTLFKKTFHKDSSIDFQHPGVLLEQKDRAAILFRAIDSLADRQKTAFILSYIEGLPRQEVAEIMETSLKAIEALLQRSKQSLRKKLEKMYPHQRNSSAQLSNYKNDE